MQKETRDALIAQQQMVQASLDEVIREVSERVWSEGFKTGVDHSLGELPAGAPKNPYRVN